MKYRHVERHDVNLYSYESDCFFLSGVLLFRISIEKNVLIREGRERQFVGRPAILLE